jgi:hypothetical protein
MNINYWAVLVCGVLSMVIGFVWYGPLFGKKWLEIVGATFKDVEERKKMQKAAGPLYLLQFIMTLFQVAVLDYCINMRQQYLLFTNYNGGRAASEPLYVALIVWAGFIIPIVAGSAMWNNDSAKISRARFLIQAGYQLVLFVVFGLVLGMWK